MTYFKQVFIAVLLFSTTAAAITPASIMLTGEIPPYASEVDELKGICIDIATEVFARADMPLTTQFLPWARTIRKLQIEKNYLICPLTRTIAREDTYQWLLPVYDYNLVIVTNNPKLPSNDIDALRELRACSLSASPASAKAKKIKFKHMTYLREERVCMEMLALGRVDVVITHGVLNAIYGYKVIGLDHRVLKTLVEFPLGTIYIAGSKDSFSTDYVDALRKGMDEIKNDGTYKKILDKYK